mmetsp:Transcript_585/g.1032  ORF Transcript_585/g.1032 Transcript_585/m.1032 type:complete len:328 (+) Transcript_585:960-1943(+)
MEKRVVQEALLQRRQRLAQRLPHRGVALVPVGAQQDHERGRVAQAGLDQRGLVQHQPRAVRRAQRPRRHRLGELLHHIHGVLDTHWHVLAQVELHPAPFRAGHLNGHLLLPEELVRRWWVVCVPGVPPAHDDRDGPQLRVARPGAVLQKPALAQLERAPPAGLCQLLHLHHRVAHLLGPALHHLPDGQARGLLPCAPQVEGLGVSVLVPAHVEAQALLEVLKAEHGAQHADHAGALAVGDGVEHLLHLLRVRDGHLDGVAGAEGVQTQRGGLVVHRELVPHLPVGEQLVRGPGLRPAGEPLVEPEVVPPGHGHQVAEPLVRQLVGHH